MPKYLKTEYNFSITNVDEITKSLLSDFVVKSNAVKNNIDQMLKMTFIGIGQAGGRMVAPANSLGFPTYVINSSKDDFKELDNYSIPKQNMIFTGVYDRQGNVIDTMQGTSKDRNRGLEIASLNVDKYSQLAQADEVLGAEFVWLAASLGGGTGSGAIYNVAKEIIFSREKYNAEIKGIKEENSVGLILSIPSSKEAGIAYRRNALQALQELQQLIKDAENDAANGYETFGAIYVIDNEHFSESNFLKNYKENVVSGYKTSELKLSNAYAITSIFEFLSFLCLKGSSTVDRNELASLLGTTGFLNIKRDDSNEELVQEFDQFKADTTHISEESINTISTAYATKFVDTEDVLMDMKEMDSNASGIGFTIVNPDQINSDYARNIVAEILNAKKILNTHPGVYEMKAQKGITTFLAYVTKSFPIHVTKRLSEEYKSLEKIENDLLEKRKKEETELEAEIFKEINLTNKNSRSLLANTSNLNERRGGLGGALQRREGGLSSSMGNREGGLSPQTNRFDR